jgi:hypothetical protein
MKAPPMKTLFAWLRRKRRIKLAHGIALEVDRSLDDRAVRYALHQFLYDRRIK